MLLVRWLAYRIRRRRFKDTHPSSPSVAEVLKIYKVSG
jgi:hypothetical protein